MLLQNEKNIVPTKSVFDLYAMLTPENKEKVKKFIADLKEKQ
jgi:hypothetical protein